MLFQQRPPGVVNKDIPSRRQVVCRNYDFIQRLAKITRDLYSRVVGQPGYLRVLQAKANIDIMDDRGHARPAASRPLRSAKGRCVMSQSADKQIVATVVSHSSTLLPQTNGFAMTEEVQSSRTSAPGPGHASREGFYREFEERFRGPRELISSRLRVYLPFIEPLKSIHNRPVGVDLGCGRGEWLELLTENGFGAQGIDLDEGMLWACRERGLRAHKGDAIAFLEQLPNESRAIVSGFHIAEHLPFPKLEALVREALRVLQPAGLLILETPNSENFRVASLSFYCDPTHRRPLPPDLLFFLTEYYGFSRIKVIRLQESSQILKSQNASLGDVLGGSSPDYAVIAQKAATTSTAAQLFDNIFQREFGIAADVLIERFDRQLISQNERLRNHNERFETLETHLEEERNAWLALGVRLEEERSARAELEARLDEERNARLVLEERFATLTNPLRGMCRAARRFAQGTRAWLTLKPRLLRAVRAQALAVMSRMNSMRRYLKPLERRPGVLFIGYAEGDLGLGQAFRANLVAAAQVGLPFAVYPFRVGIKTRLIEPFMPERYDTAHAYDINIVDVAPDQTPAVFRTLDPRLMSRGYNVLRTFWELPQAPEAWRPMLKGFQELWAPSPFVAEAFREIFPGTITIIPPAIHRANGPFADREAYGMEPGRFYFLCSFDYFSSPHRKNPLAVLQAFQEAFAHRTDNVGLVIKSIGAVEHFPEIKDVILKAAKCDSRITVINRSLKRHEMLSLIRASNAYISLHRSEGFGMGMAEAMSFGRVVIGTNFSGNTCFLTSETGFPVPYTLRPVKPSEYAWASGQVWAEPDVKAAAEIMRLVIERPDLAAKRAQAAEALIESRYEPEAVGLKIKRRISEIEAGK
jgi:glycosyltransferase involved in cell wall biosynthesis/SAM-dependent methyltransferase